MIPETLPDALSLRPGSMPGSGDNPH